jgi:hypothetical protein
MADAYYAGARLSRRYRRVLIADHAAADAGLPPGSEGVVIGRIGPAGPYSVVVDAVDVGASGRPPVDEEARAAITWSAAREGLGALNDSGLALLGRSFLFRAGELTPLPEDPPG